MAEQRRIENGSTETFDKKCQVCEEIEGATCNESDAVKYCKPCQQYLCSRCCIYHEKGGVTKHHGLVEVSNATDIVKERQLFERQPTPFSFITIPNRNATQVNATQVNEIKCMKYNCGSDRFIVLHHYTITKNFIDGFQLYCQTQNLLFKTFNLSRSTYTVFLPSTDRPNDLILCTHNTIKTLSMDFNKDTCSAHDIMKAPQNCTYLAIEEFNNHIAILLRLDTNFPTLPKWQIQCITHDGKFTQQVCYDGNDKPIFSDPKFLTTNIEKTILYVSDCGDDSVIALDVDGNVLFRFKHDDMKNPDGMCVDDEDNIYVACETNLFQIKKDGKESRVLLETPKSRLTRVAFDHVNRTLAVCEAKSLTISVLRFAK